MQSIKRVKSQLSKKLSDKAQQGYTYNNLKTGTLLSVGKLAYDNCVYIFSRHHVNVIKIGKVIIKGRRNPINGFYNTPLAPTAEPSIPSSSQQQALGVIQNSKTRQELAGYFHACMFSPTPETFLRDIKKGHSSYWMGLIVSLIYKHLAKYICQNHGPTL